VFTISFDEYHVLSLKHFATVVLFSGLGTVFGGGFYL